MNIVDVRELDIISFLERSLQHFEAEALDVVSIIGQHPVLGGLAEAVRDTAWRILQICISAAL